MKTHILLIEDQVNLAHFIALELLAEGYKVSVEHHAKIGLTAAQVLCPDIIILSWDFPGESASKIYHQLRSMGNQISIVGMTVDARNHTIDHLKKDGIIWLMKPFSMQDLLNAIHQIDSKAFPRVEHPQAEKLLRTV
ncbi:response regulator transcription factor [Leptolyngbya sp. AN03gr2]|uniref:response regulator transcription factor n=1 Tax=unclassified Leptolyngbya TaxID=2650499 RepID=UPI003D31C4B2